MRRGEVSRARLKIRVFYNDRLVYTTQETCVYYMCVCVCVCVCVCQSIYKCVWFVYTVCTLCVWGGRPFSSVILSAMCIR